MKIETIELFDRIYTKMLQKVSKAILAKGDIDFHDYCHALLDARNHILIIAEKFDFDDSITVDLDFNIDEVELDVFLNYDMDDLVSAKITEDKFLDFVAASFNLVRKDSFLDKVLGTDTYIDIVEGANLLFIQGVAEYEGIDGEVIAKAAAAAMYI